MIVGHLNNMGMRMQEKKNDKRTEPMVKINMIYLFDTHI